MGRRGEALFAVLLVIGILGVALVAWMYQPRRPDLSGADVVVVLAGADDGRHRLGIDLARRYHVPDVLLSNPDGPLEPKTHALCASARPEGVEVTCFSPEPSTTAGEAMTFARLAEGRGWDSVGVVTNRPHSHRASLIFTTCTDLHVKVRATERIDTRSLPRHVAREAAGTVKFLATRPC